MSIRAQHSTSLQNAERILASGFRDPHVPRQLPSGRLYVGVWLFAGPMPMDTLPWYSVGALFDVEVHAEPEVLERWFVEEWRGAPWREWCVPAEWLNANATITLCWSLGA